MVRHRHGGAKRRGLAKMAPMPHDNRNSRGSNLQGIVAKRCEEPFFPPEDGGRELGSILLLARLVKRKQTIQIRFREYDSVNRITLS